MLNVYVSWECVSDGKTRDGANFKCLMGQLRDEGYKLDIDTPIGKHSFTSTQTFDAYFELLA